jgi:hypothetical protein
MCVGRFAVNTNSSATGPTYDELIPALLGHPLQELRDVCHIRAGIPLKPMLAKVRVLAVRRHAHEGD